MFRFPKQKDPRYDRGGSREERNGAGDRTKTKFHARASLILPFFFLFLRSLSAKVNGACARCAEKVMDRALNVGSHGISDAGGEGVEGDWARRQSAATGHHLAFLETAGGLERCYYDYACLRRNVFPRTREKKLSNSAYFRAR